MSLSERIRSISEAAPWVIEEVKVMEKRIVELEAERDHWKSMQHDDYWKQVKGLQAELAALRQKIEDAPVAAVEKIGMTTHTFIRKEDLLK